MAEHSGKDAIRISRINSKGGNPLPVAEAKVSPGLPRVSGLVNSIAKREIGAGETFSARYVNNIWVGWCNGNRTDGLCGL